MGSPVLSEAPSPRIYCCLFVKIYFEDPALYAAFLQELAPFLERSERRFTELKHFFFIRYADPKPHIRLRLFGTKASISVHIRDALLGEVRKIAAKHGAVRTVNAKYRPETRRYGGTGGVRLHEKVSHASTRLILRFEQLPLSASRSSRILFALASSEALLSSLGLKMSERKRLYALYDRSIRARTDEPSSSGHLHDFKRRLQPHVDTIRKDPARYLSQMHRQLSSEERRFHESLTRLRTQIRGISKSSERTDYIFASYYHMHFNRLGFDPLEERILAAALLPSRSLNPR